MEDVCPQWLNKEYLEPLIRSYEDDQTVRIVSLDVTRMAAKGNHFMSDICRAVMLIERGSTLREMALVVKIAPGSPDLSKIAEDGDFFELEMVLLKNISPRLLEVIQDLPPGGFKPFTPRYIHSPRNPTAILMEDLNKAGFRVGDRKVGLDYKHSLLVLKTLARYHAASVVLDRQDPSLLDVFKKKDPDLAFKEMIDGGAKSGLQPVKELVESWPHFQGYGERIEKAWENCGDQWFAARSKDDGDFNVLIHGDLWLTNLMFKYSEGGVVEDVRFIDFQFSYWTSPVVDLLYFLYSSTEINIADRHEELIEEYHRTLTEALEFFGLPSPSLEELREQMKKRRAIALQTAIGFRLMVMADDDQVRGLPTETSNENKAQFSERYKEALRVLLPVFKSKAWL